MKARAGLVIATALSATIMAVMTSTISCSRRVNPEANDPMNSSVASIGSTGNIGNGGSAGEDGSKNSGVKGATTGIAREGGSIGNAGNAGKGTSDYVRERECPSCATPNDCLREPDSKKSFCSSLFVPGGKFMMGRGAGTDACPSNMNCGKNEQPEHEVAVSDFYLDKFEVTLGRFRVFVEKYDQAETKPKAGAGAHPKIPDSGWKVEWDKYLPSAANDLKSSLYCDTVYSTWKHHSNSTDMGNRFPINCVGWYVAFAFCAWDGGRLPTEAEWEYAAAGGGENRLYPWGSETLTTRRASFACRFDGKHGCHLPDIAPVGELPAGQGRWGHQDLVGNMAEWVLDWYDDEWYSGQGNKCIDCANLNTGSGRVQRGSSFFDYGSGVRAASRVKASLPTYRSGDGGFRCARDR